MDTTRLFFDAFANSNRFAILKELRKRPVCVGDMCKILKIEQTNLSHNLKCLVNCRFVNVKREGRKRVYNINDETGKLLDGVLLHIKRYEEYLEKCGSLK